MGFFYNPINGIIKVCEAPSVWKWTWRRSAGYLGLVPQAMVVQQHSLLLSGKPPQVSLKLLWTKAIDNVKLDAIFPVYVSKALKGNSNWRKYQI